MRRTPPPGPSSTPRSRWLRWRSSSALPTSMRASSRPTPTPRPPTATFASVGNLDLPDQRRLDDVARPRPDGHAADDGHVRLPAVVHVRLGHRRPVEYHRLRRVDRSAIRMQCWGRSTSGLPVSAPPGPPRSSWTPPLPPTRLRPSLASRGAARPGRPGKVGSTTSGGRPWVHGSMAFTMINTFATPNSVQWTYCSGTTSCSASTFSEADSYHSGGVNVLLGDGSVRFIKSTIKPDRLVGARDQGAAARSSARTACDGRRPSPREGSRANRHFVDHS